MTKIDRKQVFDKTNGKCGYCGCLLTDKWHVDHMEPQYMYDNGFMEGDKNHCDNLIAACTTCNHYKRATNVELFRKTLANLHKHWCHTRKCYAEAPLKRQAYMKRVCDAFQITPTSPFSGTFYFETLKNVIRN